MTPNWTTLREILLPVTGGRGRRVESALRAAVRGGQLAPGIRLPSSRDLAAQLGVARGTITAAYGQLVAEGYLVSRRGSGTTVAAALGHPAAPPQPAPPPASWRFDLRPGIPALAAFPRAEWVAATRAALADLPDEALGYPDPAGLAELRAELAGYLGRVRAVAASADDVVITHGGAEALSVLAHALLASGHRDIAVEEPGHPGQADLLRANGLRPVPVQVDGAGIVVDALAATRCRAVVVTAAHQFPLGVALHPDRRRALLTWARDRAGVIVEDDYDAEHRYDRPALRAMQAMDPAHVAYLGSVSKTLAPALRLGWLVLPPALRAETVERKRLTDLGCSPLPQAAFAGLLRTGGYDRHLRRTRALYRQRRDALLSAVAAHLPAWHPVGVAAGLHVVLRLPASLDDAAVQRRLAERGIHAPALSTYTRGGAGAPYPGLVLGYAATSPDRLRAAVREIALTV
ncbi:MAG: aminotransferase class I/II-fold pyridoxal phosphate-dependent enzyme [Actinophytocola sp.]|uniref:MocR-like pyridoxine biosynthesis transcription factor PdxR n=1 Tax=Actinophytocola sp. TaxID=1872138 RepID=UPI0013254C57|nr:PLP-dependent aminotransferase family protein [Actinophytocola sp.]MPZ79515.1 aminotransferase class I/II-fold pyridoxal phosphate-dependent enzyme [Actinophytocola sp.]